MRTRPAVWLLVLALAGTAGAQTTAVDGPEKPAPGVPQDDDPSGETARPAPAPDRFLPTDRIPPDSVISFPADI
jgi:hypothetical protein